MLGVSVVAWLALLLAELGQFRLGLLGLLLTIGAFGLSLLVYAFREGPAGPAAAAGWLKPALAATAGILLCAALFLPPYETAVAGGDATVYLNFGRRSPTMARSSSRMPCCARCRLPAARSCS